MLQQLLSFLSDNSSNNEPPINLGSYWTRDDDEEMWAIVCNIKESRLVEFDEYHMTKEPIKKVLPWPEFLYQYSPLETYVRP